MPCVRLPTDNTTPAAEYHGQRPDDQAHIPPQRPVGDVQVIEAHHLLERDARAAEYLPEAGDSGCEVQSPASPLANLLVLLGHERPRADEAHISLQHVP